MGRRTWPEPQSSMEWTGVGQLARRLAGPYTGSICSSSPSTASIWWKAACEPMTTRVAPEGKQVVQGLMPSPGCTTHPTPTAPVLTQDPEDGRARTSQPEEGKGDSPSQSVLMGWAHLSAWRADGIAVAAPTLGALSPSNPRCPSASGITHSGSLRIIQTPTPRCSTSCPHPFL